MDNLNIPDVQAQQPARQSSPESCNHRGLRYNPWLLVAVSVVLSVGICIGCYFLFLKDKSETVADIDESNPRRMAQAISDEIEDLQAEFMVFSEELTKSNVDSSELNARSEDFMKKEGYAAYKRIMAMIEEYEEEYPDAKPSLKIIQAKQMLESLKMTLQQYGVEVETGKRDDDVENNHESDFSMKDIF